jgi:hypothetical protein
MPTDTYIIDAIRTSFTIATAGTVWRWCCMPDTLIHDGHQLDIHDDRDRG